MEWRREGEGVWSAVCVVNMKASRPGIVDWLPDLSLSAVQCTFGVLQAGQYGVPQTRRR